MDFAEQLSQFAQRIEALKSSICTEEATKTSLVMPFFQMLGYDVFNPLEFVPEFVADVGIKKREKIDYAIVIDGKPLVLIECKSCNDTLTNHDSQLFRYFGTSEAKFAILTNGIVYKFFTDLEDKNKMDSTPFLEFNIANIKENLIPEIKKFSKEILDVDAIFGSAAELKYTRLIRDWFIQELDNPSAELVKLIMTSTYDGQKTQKAVDKFTTLTKRSFKQVLTDTMSEKLKTVLEKDQKETAEEIQAQLIKESKIVTTEEEIESFNIIRAILRSTCDVHRIYHRDAESYFSILLDDNNRKWICRLYLKENAKYLIIPDKNKNAERYDLSDIVDIYKYVDELVASCKNYL